MILSIITMSAVHIRSSTVPFVLVFSFDYWVTCLLKWAHGIVIIPICYSILVHSRVTTSSISQPAATGKKISCVSWQERQTEGC